MKFTYDAYVAFLKKIKEHGYRIADYKNWRDMGKCVILRHDIDYDIDKAVRLSEVENCVGG